jgi:hypothetical protein
MSQILGFLAISMLLIAVLFFLLYRTGALSKEVPGVSDEAFSVPQVVDDSLKQLSERIFGSDDWEFVQSHASAASRHLFLKERRRLAHAWLFRVQRDARCVMRAHRLAAANMERLRPSLEIQLGVGYLVILMSCKLLAGLISLVGPTGVHRVVASLTDLSARLRGMAEIELNVQEFSAMSASRRAR